MSFYAIQLEVDLKQYCSHLGSQVALRGLPSPRETTLAKRSTTQSGAQVQYTVAPA